MTLEWSFWFGQARILGFFEQPPSLAPNTAWKITGFLLRNKSVVSVVSLYCQRTGLTLALQDYTDQKTGEMSVIRDLLAGLQDRGVVLTLDALHAQKKRLPPS